MLVFVVDDEPLLLHDAALTVKEAAPKAEIRSFARPAAALQAMSEQGLHPELVFSDIEMPGMSGLEFAVRLKKLSPDTRVVFVTGYAQYALDAFKVRAQGYSLKPLTVEQVREELEVLASSFETKKETQRKKLCVRCFGHFEVYWQGEPVVFARRQSKELFAFLIDREGAVCTPEQAAAALWPDESDLKLLKHRLRNLIGDLKSTLHKIGMENVLVRERRQLAIRRDLVDCDYYHMLEGDMEALNHFRGDYMLDYSWAELTAGELYFRYRKW